MREQPAARAAAAACAATLAAAARTQAPPAHALQALLVVYACMAAGSLLIGAQVLAGYCVYGAATFLYFGAYAPLLYATFLAEFFSDEQLDIDMLYYSEMRDAGMLGDEQPDELLW
jgi:hypothetical protein